MKLEFLKLAVLLTSIVLATPVLADSHGKFPGKGSIDAYNKAAFVADKALEFSKKGDFESAIKCDREAISIYPFDSATYHNLGVHLAKLAKYDEARKAQEQAILIEPHYVGAYIAIGITFEQQRKLTDAEKYYRKAVEVEPGYESVGDLADILRLEGRFSEAREWYLKAKAYPDSAKFPGEIDAKIKQCDLKEASN